MTTQNTANTPPHATPQTSGSGVGHPGAGGGISQPIGQGPTAQHVPMDHSPRGEPGNAPQPSVP